MSYKFSRDYILKAGKEGGRGVEIKPPFHLEFDVDKTPDEQPNQHQIKVFNIKKETYQEITKPDTFIVLYASYKDEQNPVIICSGEVLESYVERNGRDVITVLEVADGMVAYRDTAVSLGYSGGIDAHSIIKEISAQMGLSLMMNKKLPNRKWSHGFSHFGAAHEALHKVAKGAGLEWSIQNNMLQVVKKQGKTTRKAIVISSNSGMIGSPKRVRVGAKDKKSTDKKKDDRQPRNGWQVEALLAPQLNPRDYVKIKSKDVDGFFICESVKHSGSYQSGAWKTIIEVVDE